LLIYRRKRKDDGFDVQAERPAGTTALQSALAGAAPSTARVAGRHPLPAGERAERLIELVALVERLAHID
jgi:hypothetical protein